MKPKYQGIQQLEVHIVSLSHGQTFLKRVLLCWHGAASVKGGEPVPLCLMNIIDMAQEIYKGTLMAKMTTAEEENASKVSKEPGVGLESDLQELLDRCKGNLSHAKALDVERFLHKCRHLFAPWNFDLGRTAVVKQRINTVPTEKFIKLGVRRI